MKLFVDTWGWIALADRKENHHAAVRQLLEERGRVAGRVVTTDYVLDETLTWIFQRRPFPEAWRFVQGLLSSSARRSMTIERVGLERFGSALELRRRFADKPRISFTDLTSMVIMRELEVEEILTADTHFQQVGLGFQILPD